MPNFRLLRQKLWLSKGENLVDRPTDKAIHKAASCSYKANSHDDAIKEHILITSANVYI